MTQEQVIKALELCTSKIETRTQIPCETCPYHNRKYHGVLGDGCCNARSLQRDILALLKPRLLSEEDFINNPNVDSEGNLPAWIEYRRDEDWAEYWDDTKDEWAIVRKTNFKAIGYRCWNAKPSKEQMETTDWQKEEDDAASSEKP